MSSTLPVKALRISNEAFLVASTIERCPKTMMLRELVMNALEAARDGLPPRLVEIRPVMVDGVRKLGIWNTGTGLSAAELDQICDLASTLRKQTGMDQNFGMGAKVASLPSNRHGMRFRSCREGRVSEVILGQRDGIYGRLPVAPGAVELLEDVADVTELCRGGYDLSSDWTEVVLFGQAPGQDTAADPYNGNPAVQPDWLMTSLTRRFFRLPSGLELRLAPGVGASDATRRFSPLSDRWHEFQQAEAVRTASGVILHYAFTPDPARTVSGGSGSIIHRDEIYGIVEGPHWMLDGPVYGFPFGARFCTVMVELPAGFKVWPEVYRQFLRFREGDQRQVFLRDFAELIRANIPGWLRDIIASFGPAKADHLGEITGELGELLKMLQVPPGWRGTPHVRGAETDKVEKKEAEQKKSDAPKDEEPPKDKPAPEKDEKPEPPPPPKPPPEPAIEKPPEIIALTDEAQIEERGLTGRAAAYVGNTHQLFINLRYPAVAGMQARLRHSFEAVPDPAQADAVAAQVAEWGITRLVARRLVYTLSKHQLGWTGEEVVSAQSPASFSATADDYESLMPLARRRMAQALGLAATAAPDAPSATALKAQQIATSLEAAKQAAQRAPTRNQATPFMLRISELELARRNLPAAQEWAEKAAAASPQEAWLHGHLATVMRKQGDLDAAEQHARQALSLSSERPAGFLNMLADIAHERNDLPAAVDWIQQAVASAPDNPHLYNSLSSLLQASGDIDGSERAVQHAMSLTDQPPVFLLHRQGDLALHQRKFDEALSWANKIIEAEPRRAASYSFLMIVHQHRRDWDAALQAALTAVELSPDHPAPHLRAAGNIAMAQRDLAAAEKFIAAAIASDPSDPWTYLQESQLHQTRGDLPGAEQAARKGLDLAQDSPVPFLRRMAEIAQAQSQPTASLEWLQKALAANPRNTGTLDALASTLLQQNNADGAWQAAMKAQGLRPSNGRLRQLSEIALKREGPAAAREWADKAIAADPNDPWVHYHLSGLLQQMGDLPGAVEAAKQALALEAAPTQDFFKWRVATLEQQSQTA